MAGKKNLKKFIAAVMVFGGAFGIVKIVKEIRGEKRRSMQSESGGMEIFGKETMYAKICKPLLDSILSFAGLIILSPLFMILSVAVFIDDPGAILFTQERIGRGKEYFRLHKFRSMKMSTPHDVPTHQLSDPEQYITRVGKFLRKYSLDELPQIWDIFVGNMSIIGPRPALWNQDDLVAERDKYGANDIKPGLTGWAQINGRDELEITEKAKLDGEYVEQLRQGGMKALFFDVKCFLGTVRSVLHSEGVVEGGTGEMYKTKEVTKCNISVNDMYTSSFLPLREDKENNYSKKILVVGSGSYIGTSVRDYLNKTKKYNLDEMNAVDLVPDATMFRGYDVVFHVAGIVHRKEREERYYKVNRDLTIDVAEAAKKAGVQHFILLSSMSVYGIKSGCITKDTKAMPDTHYGWSKLQADIAVWEMRDEKFRVSILRPPMVYGRKCKGNYQLLRKYALKAPFFPDIKNRRSMIYIGNLCAFVKRVIDNRQEGVFFPQNDQYICTSKMVKCIADLNRKKIKNINTFNLLIKYIQLPVIEKVFGNLVYEKTEPVGIYDFESSMEETEKLDMRPLVSITTATYNSEKTLARTIESVLNQTYDHIEYIIVDGLSKDRTLQIAEGYRKRFEQKGISYRVISEDDRGMYDAINKGIRSSKGEIIGNINSDDWYETETVEKVVKKYNEKQFDFMYGNLKIIFPNERIKIKKAKKMIYTTSRHWNHPTQFATRELYIKEPYKLESMYDDFDLFLRVKRKGYHIEILNEPLANFTIEGMSHKRSVHDAIERGGVRYKIYKNNGYSRCYLPECFLAEILKLVMG